jgi:hypothetical protein
MNVTTLYHFTRIRSVPSIMRRGLLPHCSCRLVGYASVVWLTEQPTRRDFPPGWRQDCLDRGWRGSPTWLYNRPFRLAVSKPNVPVLPWLEWVSGQPFSKHFDMWFARRHMSKWWIAFAPISPDRISVGA